MSTQDQNGSFLALLTPANNSGVVGLARLTLNGDNLRICTRNDHALCVGSGT
jgi:hypothetical protein